MLGDATVIAALVIGGGVLGILVAVAFSRRHRHFMLRWTLEVDRIDDRPEDHRPPPPSTG